MIVDLEQGTPAWESFRATRRMASESAALLRLAPWFPRTPYELFEVKSGLRKVRVTPAMTGGLADEPLARALYEIERSNLMMPCVVDGKGGYAASLDGRSFHGDRLLEVKRPLKGSASRLWAEAVAGRIPKHYQVQVQHQLMANEVAEICDYTVYAWDTHRIVIIEVRHDLAMQARIRAAWDGFWPDYAAGRAPGEDYLGLLKASLRAAG